MVSKIGSLSTIIKIELTGSIINRSRFHNDKVQMEREMFKSSDLCPCYHMFIDCPTFRSKKNRLTLQFVETLKLNHFATKHGS